jgi:DNA/RNA-binding domain of Phe-tRNA-synthetase-like protein
MIPLQITLTPAWRQAFPGAYIGLLQLEVSDNTPRPTPLDEHKRQLAIELRQRYAGMGRPELLRLPEMDAYRLYYKRFDKTYHVLLQLESVIFAAKELPSVSPLVDACFAAELESLLLTASHDLAQLDPPVEMDVSQPGDELIQMNGSPRSLKAGDMIMRSHGRVACTVIYGQERRSVVTPATRRVLYVTYAPPGITAAQVEAHHELIYANVRRFEPQAQLLTTVVQGFS